MIRRFVHDGAIYATGTAVLGAVGFLLLPVLARMLPPSDYGALDICQLIILLVTVVVTLEVQQGLARFFHEARPGLDRGGLCRSALIVTAAGGAVGALLLYLSDDLLARLLLGDESYARAIQITGQNLLLGAIFGVVHRQLRWSLRPRAYLAVALVAGGANLAVTLGLLWGSTAGMHAPLWGQGAGYLVGGALAGWLVRRDLVGSFSWPWLKTMWAFSLPLVLSTLGVMGIGHFGRLALAWMLSLDQVAAYAVALRIAGVAGILLGGVLQAVTPLIYAHHRDAGAARDIVGMLRVFLGLALPAWAAMAILAGDLVAVLAGDAYTSAAGVVPILLAATIWASLYVFFPGLDLSHRTWRIAAVNLILGGLNVAACLVLIPWSGIIGAALACLAASLLHGLAYFHVGRSGFPMALPATIWACLAVMTVLAVLSGSHAGQDLLAGFGLPGRIVVAAGLASLFLVALRPWRMVSSRTQ